MAASLRPGSAASRLVPRCSGLVVGRERLVDRRDLAVERAPLDAAMRIAFSVL